MLHLVIVATALVAGEQGPRPGQPVVPLGLGCLVSGGQPAAMNSGIPDAWLKRWHNPPPGDRPLQIVHGISRPIPFYRDRGLGGLVCNVPFKDYMRSEKGWKDLLAGVEACRQHGLVVWLYDEEGYPSGAAGGQVLAENRAFEAAELAFDPNREEPFVVRASYEHTHASNNFYAARRYINIIDKGAVGCFIRKTHDAYWQRLEAHFGKTIQAVFTDEPSLLAVNLGQLEESVRKNVRIVDPLDPALPALPCVPWSSDLAEIYRERYGQDLLAQRRSLFQGDTPADRELRRRFWALIADLVAERYFGAIQTWCSQRGIASSGHSLWEEKLMHHPALMGNGLKALGRMDIPGLDLLSSNPATVIQTGWLTAALPTSAGELNGRRRVMTEVSDFIEKMGGKGPASLAEMEATAAWQASWGVTDFALYYGIGDRSAAEYRAYCDYVGRLNAVLKPARRDAQILLYYPIYDLWAEYLPVAGPLKEAPQSPRAQRIVRSFMEHGQRLQRSQQQFTLVDHEHLAAADVDAAGNIVIGPHTYHGLVMPEGVELPAAAARIVARMDQERGALRSTPRPNYRLTPSSERIALGAFRRDGCRVVLVVNVGKQPYVGQLSVPSKGRWIALDPGMGTMERAKNATPSALELALAPRQARILVERLDSTIASPEK